MGSLIGIVVLAGVFVGVYVGRRWLHGVWPEHRGTVDLVFVGGLLVLYLGLQVVVRLLERRLKRMGQPPDDL